MRSIHDIHRNTARLHQETVQDNKETAQNYKWVGIIMIAALVYDFSRKKK